MELADLVKAIQNIREMLFFVGFFLVESGYFGRRPCPLVDGKFWNNAL